MGIKEGTCYEEHQVLYGSIDSLHCTLETNITLYANYLGFKLDFKNLREKNPL